MEGLKKKNLLGMDVDELLSELQPYGIKKFRARQIAEWIYQKGVHDFSDMTNLPKALRGELDDRYVLTPVTEAKKLESSDGHTTKFLFCFEDGTSVETVLMRQPYGNSICVSTQAGCNMGCAFCASTLHGSTRDLSTGEIIAQALAVNDYLRAEGGRVDHIVVMGSGEPMLNYDNVIHFLHIAHEEYALGISYRNMTVSTSGIIPGIHRLAEENIPITLSISLHAPEDELRSELMPVNRKYPLPELIRAGKAYGDKTKRRVTYEYILIDEVNDTPRHAAELAELLRGQLASVNLIPINPVTERDFRRPSTDRIEAFRRALEDSHISVTVRKEMGADMNAACGQLRNRYLERA